MNTQQPEAENDGMLPRTVAERADERHAAALKVIEKLEAEGCTFSEHPEGGVGWTISGPRGAYGRFDEELTEYASEITSVLAERLDYIDKLVILDDASRACH